MKIALITFDDFTDLDLILHWDILNRVRTYGGIADWSVKILGTKESHLSAFGLPIPTSGRVELAAEADGVILCSGKGLRPLLNDDVFAKRLGLDPERQFIGAQCSGSLLLGPLGFLKGVKVSGYPLILKELAKFEADPVAKPFVVDGKVATASGCLAGQYLSRWMIESLAGEEVAKKVMSTVSPI